MTLQKPILILFFILLFLLMKTAYSDPPAPPSPGGNPTGAGQPVGAPLDGGATVLLILGTGYLVVKRRFGKRKKETIQAK
jgi:hypothetical protein